MHVEAIYNQGRLEFTLPLKLKHDKVRVLVEVPDDEIVANDLPEQQAAAPIGNLRAEIDAILGPYKQQLQDHPPHTAQDYKDMWHEHLEEKYLGPRQASDR